MKQINMHNCIEIEQHGIESSTSNKGDYLSK